jgi:hypothetical protein
MAAAGDLEASGQPAPALAQGAAGKPVSPPEEERKSFLDWLYVVILPPP